MFSRGKFVICESSPTRFLGNTSGRNMPEQDNNSTASNKNKTKGERRHGRPETDAAKDEIKKFKENLLQSVSSGDPVITESNLEISVPQQSRSRSASRAREALCIPANVLAEIDESKIFELKEAFLLFDMDGDGCIDYNDLKATLVSLGDKVDEQILRSMLSEEKAEACYKHTHVRMLQDPKKRKGIVDKKILLNIMGFNRAPNPLDFDGFVNLLGYKTLELDSEETLVAALSRWDKDNSGYISEERLRHDLMTWGDRFTEKEADYALNQAPTIYKDGYPMIDYIKFCSQLCGLKKPSKISVE